jgi:hypothetical protein
MKKTIYTLSIAFLALGISACAKSTKGRLTNDWKVVSSQQENKTVNQSGDVTTESIFMTAVAVTHSSSFIPATGTGYTSSIQGNVKANTISIKKDGTWIWNQELSFDDLSGNLTKTLEQSGTWSFAGKTKGDDFKKNERVIFNVLSDKLRTVQTVNQSVVTDYTDAKTSLTGEDYMIFTVEESKNKKLQLNLDESRSSKFGSNSASQAKKLNMTLEQK